MSSSNYVEKTANQFPKCPRKNDFDEKYSLFNLNINKNKLKFLSIGNLI